MQFWNNRGLIYSFLLGYVSAYVYFPLLGWVAGYLEIPLTGYLISKYSFDAKITVYAVMFILDTILAILVALVIAYPLGLLGKGGVFWKIGIYISAFYLYILLQEDNGITLEIIMGMLLTPELWIYLLFSSMAIYMGNKRIKEKIF